MDGVKSGGVEKWRDGGFKEIIYTQTAELGRVFKRVAGGEQQML